MTLTTADHWADVMRWWAMVGAPFGAVPLARKLWAIFKVRVTGGHADVPVPQVPLMLGGAALLCFLVFSFVAGLVLPLTSRVPGFGVDTVSVRQILAATWTVAGLGSWLAAVAFARGRWWIAGMAMTWFLAVWFATIATAGG
ncbi:MULTISPECIES: hypothetical protein [unclassified Novosphingobium]|uniref:hypothetical protein n=1 Tax=unclassified Novosphingobium TaxID=2644732 RepID=UPI00135BD26F|nr:MULTISPECIES: hypothetical protein [unclassified Novosphingobium]